MTECEDILRAIEDIDAKFGSGCRPVRFVAYDIRSLPKFTPGELDNSSILDRICKLVRQMASMQHAPTYAAGTRTQSPVTDEATGAAVTRPTEWRRQQTNLRVALPTLSTIEGGCEDSDEFSLRACQLRRAQRPSIPPRNGSPRKNERVTRANNAIKAQS